MRSDRKCCGSPRSTCHHSPALPPFAHQRVCRSPSTAFGAKLLLAVSSLDAVAFLPASKFPSPQHFCGSCEAPCFGCFHRNIDELQNLLVGRLIGLLEIFDASHRPQQAARHHVEIRRVGHRRVVVADRRREDVSLAIFVGPHAGLRFAGVLPRRGGERVRVGEHFDDVIQLALLGRPTGKALRDRVILIGDLDLVPVMRPVPRRLHADELKPLIVVRCDNNASHSESAPRRPLRDAASKSSRPTPCLSHRQSTRCARRHQNPSPNLCLRRAESSSSSPNPLAAPRSTRPAPVPKCRGPKSASVGRSRGSSRR